MCVACAPALRPFLHREQSGRKFMAPRPLTAPLKGGSDSARRLFQRESPQGWWAFAWEVVKRGMSGAGL